jgi:Fe-S cluster assembly protein SufB
MTNSSKKLKEAIEKKSNSKSRFIAKPGVYKELIEKISSDKNEPGWMLEKRLRALEIFNSMPMPSWGPNIDDLNLNEIIYYVDPDANESKSWEEVPDEIKETFEKLGIPKAEREALAGVGAQYDSGMVYHNLKEEYAKKGIIFENMDVALQKYPDLVKKYFMTRCVSVNDHKFAALHGAVWSGGTFIYVPKGVKVEMPLQAYFRMNEEKAGQFEHTIIVADEGSEISYIEGCSAPKYSYNSLHAGCVEVFVHKGAIVKYSSIENWSKNTFNLNTKRAIVEEGGKIYWLNGNMGSRITMLYPTSILLGDNSYSESLGIAFAGAKQNQDAGSKVIHIGKNSKSLIKAKSISKDGGISSYRGLVDIKSTAKGAISVVECDALMIDNKSISNTYPQMNIERKDAQVIHEAKVGKISEEELFYLMSRGLDEEKAKQLIVAGFAKDVIKKLPLEYAVELNKLIELEMENSLG